MCNSSAVPQATGGRSTAMSLLFISYSREDRGFVQRLAGDLKRAGLEVWWDHEIEAGADFVQEIGDALRRADYLLPVISPHSVDSRWVQKETNIAVFRSLRGEMHGIIPLLVADCDIPTMLLTTSWVDFRGPRKAALERLLARLAKTPPARSPYAIPKRIADLTGRTADLESVQ
jgi:hypothetical protein